MSENIASYNCISLPGLNKVEKMKCDSNGYYRIVLGGFNLTNQSGVYYPLTDGVKALFATGGVVRRRLDTGQCKGEYDHPKLDGLSHEQIIHRLSIIEPTMVSHHIKSIELVPKKNEHGKEIIVAYGMVKPAGPYADALRTSLDNTEENVAFSIRCFCKVAMYEGRIAKIVTDAMTYDHVSEPGIKLANQFDTVSLESLGKELNFTEMDFDNAIKTYSNTMGMESDAQTISMIKDHQGWHKTIVSNISSLDW